MHVISIINLGLHLGLLILIYIYTGAFGFPKQNSLSSQAMALVNFILPVVDYYETSITNGNLVARFLSFQASKVGQTQC